MFNIWVPFLAKYIDDKLQPFSGLTSKLKKHSYEKWAMNELLVLFTEEYSKSPPHISGMEPRNPIDILEDFIATMDYYSELSAYREIRYQFLVAKEVGEDVIQMFL